MTFLEALERAENGDIIRSVSEPSVSFPVTGKGFNLSIETPTRYSGWGSREPGVVFARTLLGEWEIRRVVTVAP